MQWRYYLWLLSSNSDVSPCQQEEIQSSQWRNLWTDNCSGWTNDESQCNWIIWRIIFFDDHQRRYFCSSQFRLHGESYNSCQNLWKFWRLRPTTISRSTCVVDRYSTDRYHLGSDVRFGELNFSVTTAKSRLVILFI